MNAATSQRPEIQCRQFIYEQMGFVQVSAEIVQQYAEIGDDAGIEYQLRRLIVHLRASTQTFKELAAHNAATESDAA